MEKEKVVTGRPKGSNNRTLFIKIRVNADEKSEISERALMFSSSVSDGIRSILLDKEIKKNSKVVVIDDSYLVRINKKGNSLNKLILYYRENRSFTEKNRGLFDSLLKEIENIFVDLDCYDFLPPKINIAVNRVGVNLKQLLDLGLEDEQVSTLLNRVKSIIHKNDT